MAANASNAVPALKDQEVVITRVFDAPPALVFRMWTEREHLIQWMRPGGFATIDCETMDVKPGGKMRTRMRLPDGNEYVSEWTYREIAAPSRIVYDETCTENGKLFHRATQTVTFAAQANKTLLTIQVYIDLVPGRNPQWTLDAMKQGWQEGWGHNFDLLQQHVEGNRREIMTTRLYDAPRELVFKMWTEAEHIAQWWGPNGFSLTTGKMDVRPGGKWDFVMHGPDGTDYENHIEYVEVVKPLRLVYDHTPTPHFRATTTFEDVGGKTLLSMCMVIATDAEYDMAVRFHAVEGAKQTFARLADHLARR